MPEVITPEDAQSALELVRRICEEVGPGLPASPQERERAEIIRKELESHLGAENVAVEEFTLEPLLNVLKLTFEWVRNGGEEA